MAIMINCATDWTFDLFAEAMDSVKALPMAHGVRPSSHLTEAQKLATWVKTKIKFADFGSCHSVENRINDILCDNMYFSDWYKEIYGQRPHFRSYLIGALCGVYGSEYSIAQWTWHNPLEEYKQKAREQREALEKMTYKEYGY